jgi:hypothetical protein
VNESFYAGRRYAAEEEVKAVKTVQAHDFI